MTENLEKAIKLSQYYDDYIKFQRGSELYSVAYGEVRYFSTTGRKVEIHTTSVDLDFYGKLDDVQAKTPPGFIRIHKSYLIHETYVKKWEYEMVVMDQGEQLSISPRYRKAVREMLMKRWRGVVHVSNDYEPLRQLDGILDFSFMNIFFEKGEQKERFIRYIAFGILLVWSSALFTILNWPPFVLLSTSMAGIFLMTLTYRGKWKTRIIAALLVGGLHLVLEDVSYRLLIVLHSEYIIPLILAVTDLLFFLCMIVAKKIADKKKGQEIPLSEWLAVILIPGISIFFSAIVLDQCRDEKAAFLGGCDVWYFRIWPYSIC